MSLKDQITEDMKNAMRAKEAERLGAIRLLLAAIKQREVDERVVVDDAGVIAIVEKAILQPETLETNMILDDHYQHRGI